MPAEPPAPMNMPMPKNKKALVGKTQAPQKYESSTVQACMCWPENDLKQKGKGKKGKGGNKNQEIGAEEVPQRQEYTKFLHGKAEVGKARRRGFDLHTPPPPEQKDYETAIRALRGWSDTYPGEENWIEEKEPNTEENNEFTMYKNEQGRVQSKKRKEKKGKKEEGKKGLMSEYDDDVHMGEILGYKFGNEEAQRRLKQLEKEQAKKERAAADAADAKKAMKKVKHTQASIARTNRNIEKCTKVKQELWKMPKFTKNAQPAIDTKRNKPFSHHNGNAAKGYGGSDAIAIREDCNAECADLSNDFTDININTGSPDPYTGEYQMMNEGPYDGGCNNGWYGEYCECKGAAFDGH